MRQRTPKHWSKTGTSLFRPLTAAALACMALLAPAVPTAADPGNWVVYYANNVPIEALASYQLVVLDSGYDGSLAALSDRGKTVLGYISLGEVERYRAHYADVRDEGILLQENEDWPGSFYVDLRDPRWTERVIVDLVPAILHRRFDGIFIDTLDNAGHLERIDPKAYAGMTKAAARLVRAIRRHFPGIKIMLNRAYEILPDVENHIDMVLGESVHADFDFENKVYRLVPDKLRRKQVELLQAAKARRPELQVMTLDYWDPDDSETIRRIYRAQRANGFLPYVATLELNRIVPEPAP